MFVRLVLVLFCFFAFNSEQAIARSAKNKSKVSKNYKKPKTAKKRRGGLRFEPNWYYSLKPKAKKAYLNALRTIVYKAAGGKGSASLEEKFWEYLIEKAYAEDLSLNIGYIYDRDVGFRNFIANLNFTYTESGNQRSLNQCTGDQSPCAIYTCMREDSNGNPVLCCGTTSTPSCVTEGRQTANREVLFEALERCRTASSSFCSTLERLMQVSSSGVAEWCAEGSRGSQGYCTEALAAIEASGGDAAPEATEAPNGGNCERVGDRLAELHDSREPAREEDAAANNNAFWRDMSYAARRVCEGLTVRQATERLGVCNVTDMAAPGVGISAQERVRTNRGEDREAYDTCIEARLDERMGDRHERELREVADLLGTIPSEEFDRRLRDARTSHATERNTLARELRGNENCTYSRDIVRPVAGAPASIHDLDTGILEKIQAGTSLTNIERNQFMAVTGMEPQRFKQTFCSANHEAFLSAFRTNASRTPILRINEDVADQVAMRSQARAANQSMRVCQENLLSQEESGCSFHEITNVAGITRVSNDNPLMAKNRDTGQCSLIVQYESDRVVEGRDRELGEDRTRLRQIITLSTPGGGSTEEQMNPHEFGQRYELFGYSCTNSAPIPGREPPHHTTPVEF